MLIYKKEKLRRSREKVTYGSNGGNRLMPHYVEDSDNKIR